MNRDNSKQEESRLLHGYKHELLFFGKKFKVLVRTMVFLSMEEYKSQAWSYIERFTNEIKNYKAPPNKFVIEAEFIDNEDKIFKANLTFFKVNGVEK